MHTFGHPVNLDALLAVANEYGISLIEDGSGVLGSFYKGIHTGNTGLLSVLSFNGNKIVTTGAGGALLTHDQALADRVRHLTTTAKNILGNSTMIRLAIIIVFRISAPH